MPEDKKESARAFGPEAKPEPEPPEPKPPKRVVRIKPVPKPSVPRAAREHMASEALNEYNVLLDSPKKLAGFTREQWLKKRMDEKVRAYNEDPEFKEAYDNWGLHHGGTKKGE